MQREGVLHAQEEPRNTKYSRAFHEKSAAFSQENGAELELRLHRGPLFHISLQRTTPAASVNRDLTVDIVSYLEVYALTPLGDPPFPKTQQHPIYVDEMITSILGLLSFRTLSAGVLTISFLGGGYRTCLLRSFRMRFSARRTGTLSSWHSAHTRRTSLDPKKNTTIRHEYDNF